MNLIKWLNKNSKGKYWKKSFWILEDNIYKITVLEWNELNNIMDFIESIVGCSYFQETNNNLITFNISKSTLEKKVKEKNIMCDDYVTVKMDRFIKEKDVDEYDKQCYYIVDKVKSKPLSNRGFHRQDILFTASTGNEVVDDKICDVVLRLINTDEEILSLLDKK